MRYSTVSTSEVELKSCQSQSFQCYFFPPSTLALFSLSLAVAERYSVVMIHLHHRFGLPRPFFFFFNPLFLSLLKKFVYQLHAFLEIAFMSDSIWCLFVQPQFCSIYCKWANDSSPLLAIETIFTENQTQKPCFAELLLVDACSLKQTMSKCIVNFYTLYIFI